MVHTNLEKKLKLINKVRVSYTSSLNSILPELLNSCLSSVKRKGVAAQLTQEFDKKGNYYNPRQRKMNGGGVYFAFPEGIIRMETVYDSNGLPKTREIEVSKEEFLSWVKRKRERSEDLYNHITSYKKEKSLENYFPTEHIL